MIGILILVLGYLFLGFVGTGKILTHWNFGKDTKEIETFVAQSAAETIPDTSLIETTVSGRDITATGLAENQVQKDAILSALNDVTGRRVVNDNIALMDVASPYVFRAEKSDDGNIAYSGNTPRNDTFNGSISSETLSLASGMPDEQWPSVVQKSYAALNPLSNATLDISDREITLTGLAKNLEDRTSVVEQFNDLPEGYAANINIDVTPTRPYVFDGQKTTDGISFQGLVPSADAIDTFTNLVGSDAQLKPAFGMPDENWPALVGKGADALAQLTIGEMKVVDRNLSITGEAANPTVALDIQTALNDLPEGYTANADLTVKPLDEYTFRGEKKGDQVDFAGFIPDETARESLAEFIGDQADNLQLAAGMPDENWPAFVGAGVGALNGLTDGELNIVDRKLTLTGTVENPSVADSVATQIGKVPQGYDVELHLTALDDGQPAIISFDLGANGAGTISGKAPNGLSDDEVAGALGLANISGGVTNSRLTGEDQIKDRLTAIGRWVPTFETANATVGTDFTNLSAVLRPGQACRLEETKSEMTTAFGENAQISLQVSEQEPENGTERVNAQTGKTEIYQDCFWLVKPEEPKPVEQEPQPAIAEPEISQPEPETETTVLPTLASCEQRTADLLQGAKINFVTAKADLDPSSLELIDQLAEILRGCVDQGIGLEVGGHTDSRGSAEYNAQLSLERASAVVAALVERGVNASAMVAKGYGESDPIASNETEEGQATNRRTTFTWNQN
ncbi:OmpA family protein [Paramylibacter kogurei]|uniref:OmpA family protein n=1 Tax=Paramylibacter kogurei TaxID=1889778 RepID=UPI001F0B5D6B|nr:OmpA family protein [Amylibacter kogurei]